MSLTTEETKEVVKNQIVPNPNKVTSNQLVVTL